MAFLLPGVKRQIIQCVRNISGDNSAKIVRTDSFHESCTYYVTFMINDALIKIDIQVHPSDWFIKFDNELEQYIKLKWEEHLLSLKQDEYHDFIAKSCQEVKNCYPDPINVHIQAYPQRAMSYVLSRSSCISVNELKNISFTSTDIEFVLENIDFTRTVIYFNSLTKHEVKYFDEYKEYVYEQFRKSARTAELPVITESQPTATYQMYSTWIVQYLADLEEREKERNLIAHANDLAKYLDEVNAKHD